MIERFTLIHKSFKENSTALRQKVETIPKERKAFVIFPKDIK